MTQVLSLVTFVTLLLAGQSAPGSSFTWPLGPGLHALPPASFGPDEELNGPALNGEIGGGFVLEGLVLPDGTRLGR